MSDNVTPIRPRRQRPPAYRTHQHSAFLGLRAALCSALRGEESFVVNRAKMSERFRFFVFPPDDPSTPSAAFTRLDAALQAVSLDEMVVGLDSEPPSDEARPNPILLWHEGSEVIEHRQCPEWAMGIARARYLGEDIETSLTASMAMSIAVDLAEALDATRKFYDFPQETGLPCLPE